MKQTEEIPWHLKLLGLTFPLHFWKWDLFSTVPTAKMRIGVLSHQVLSSAFHPDKSCQVCPFHLFRWHDKWIELQAEHGTVRPGQMITCWVDLIIIIIIINPLTTRVVGAPQIISQPVSSIFFCSPLPSWTCRTPGRSIPWCCLPTSSSVCLVFFTFTEPCKMVLARSYEWETWPYHCSLRLFTMVRRSLCGPIACWILARTSSLVTWSLYEMCSILR